jgi:ABC-2 type transport system permease protein
MRLDKVWIVARKDMSEFKTNKYIVFSLVLMPLVMSFVLPIAYLVPITMLTGDNPSAPLDLHINITSRSEGLNVKNVSVSNVSFVNSNLTNVVAQRCMFENCTLTDVLVRDSVLLNTTINRSYVIHSNIEASPRINSVLGGCVIIGETSETVKMLKVFIDSLLMFFILVPVMIPTIIASYSFVGEKLNRSLEPLLATPTTDMELLAGKSLSIFIPSMAAAWISLIPFVVLVDLIAGPVLGYYPLPNIIWVVGSFILAPLFCLLSISTNVLVSSRVNDVRASQQIGSLIVLPLVVFFVITIAGLITLDLFYMSVFVLLIAIVDAAVVYLSLKVFRREEILIRWK